MPLQIAAAIGLEKAAIPADAAEKHTAVIGRQFMEPHNGQLQKIREGYAVIGAADQTVQL